MCRPVHSQLHRLSLTAGAGVLAGVIAMALPLAQAATLNDAVFSSEQAKAGRDLYRKHCRSCHEEAYFETVMLVWNGEPLSELFSVMAAIMPQNNPGSLSDPEYLDVLAYILSIRGYPAGNLPLEAADLTRIEIQPRQ